MKTFVSVLFFGIASLWNPLAVLASWTADLGWGGTVVPGAWTPLRVQVPADAGPWTLEVRAVSASGRESGSVSYGHPVGGVFEEPVYVADATRTLKLRFLAAGLVQGETTLPLAGRIFPGHLVGVEGLGTEDRAALSEVLLPLEPVRVVTLPAVRWPSSPLSFGGLSALVLRDPGAVLSPAQTRAVQAWVASGGRLMIVVPGPGPGSLVAQVGPSRGLGRVEAVTLPLHSTWRSLLGLKPYGQFRRLGTDFAPSARSLPPEGSPASPVATIFLLVWAGLGTLALVLRRKGSLGWPLVGALAASAIAVGLWASGALAWDRGLPVHGREVVLPDHSGRFASLEALASTARSGPLDWPTASPWALALWKADLRAPGAVGRITGADRVVLDSFLPPLDRTARFRMRWEGSGLRWSGLDATAWKDLEEGPEELKPDGAWLAKMASGLPGVDWSVGLDGSTCWIRPESPGGRP